MLLRVIGWLLLIEAGFLLIPLCCSLLTNDCEVVPFTVTIAATLSCGLVLTFLLPKPNRDMSKRDGFMLTALVWVVFSLFGMIPFMFEPINLSFSSSFFETMSGFTTTGISSLDTSSGSLPHSIVLWRSLIQWIGGMGIIIFTLAVLPMFNNSGGVQMFNAEVTGITHDKLRPRVSSTAKGLWILYISLTGICTLLFWLGPMGFFESVCEAFSIMSTGGFTTEELDISAWNSTYVEIIAMLFMFLGATNFGLLYAFFHGRLSAPWRNDVFKFFCMSILVVYLMFVANNWAQGRFETVKDLTIYPLFNIISVMSSTGYVVGDLIHWGPLVMGVVFILMFFGACAGSTSGGAKLDRLLFMLKNTNNELYRGLHPNSIQGVRLNGKVFSVESVNKIIAFLSLYVIVMTVGALALAATGMPLCESFYSSLACMSNAWVDDGMRFFGNDMTAITDVAKWILSFLMLTGRLEVFTVVLLFTPQFWHK